MQTKEERNAYAREWRRNHKDRANASHTKYRLARKANGQCKGCVSALASWSTTMCERHWYAAMAWSLTHSGTMVSGQKMKEILESQDYTCPYTGIKLMPGINAEGDHRDPVCRFPEKRGDWNNIQWVHHRVNRCKADMTHNEFVGFCKIIAERFKNEDTPSIDVGDIYEDARPHLSKKKLPTTE